MPKIKQVKKEFKESKIAEELIVDYISTVKEKSPLFNKREREVWYSTESFKKIGIQKEEIEQLIEEEQEKVKSNTKKLNIKGRNIK